MFITIALVMFLGKRYKKFKQTNLTFKKEKEIIFLHRDMGYGGAERLILDIAIYFSKNLAEKYYCKIFTTTKAAGWNLSDQKIS